MSAATQPSADASQQERLAFLVEATDGRRFKMVIKGDLHKLQVEKIRRYLKGNGVPEGQDLVYNGIVLRDDMVGEDFGLIPNAVLKLLPHGTGGGFTADGASSSSAAAGPNRSGFTRSGSQQSRAHVTHSNGGQSPGGYGSGKLNTSVEGRLKQLQEQYTDFTQSSHSHLNNNTNTSNNGLGGGSQSPSSAHQQHNTTNSHPTSSYHIDPLQQERNLRMQRMTGGNSHPHNVMGSMAPSEAPSGIQYSSANVSVTSHQFPGSINNSPAKLGGGAASFHQHQQLRMNGVASSAVGVSGMVNTNNPNEAKVSALEIENDKLRRELESLRIDLQRKRQEHPPGDDMLFNAKANLLELSKDLGVHLALDQNLTCVIGNDEKNTILITFDAATERLYLYSTVLTALPVNESLRLRLFEALLDGAMLGRDMAGGGVGISTQNNIVMMGTSFSLRNSSQYALRDITPAFLEALQRWRAVAADITAGY